MNKKNLRAAGDLVAAKWRYYDQETYQTYTECGSTACVAGWAVTLHPKFLGWTVDSGLVVNSVKPGVVEVRDEDTAEDLAAEFLGLTRAEAEVIFDQDWKPAGWKRGMGKKALANRVRDALYDLADGKTVVEVTHPSIDVYL